MKIKLLLIFFLSQIYATSGQQTITFENATNNTLQFVENESLFIISDNAAGDSSRVVEIVGVAHGGTKFLKAISNATTRLHKSGNYFQLNLLYIRYSNNSGIDCLIKGYAEGVEKYSKYVQNITNWKLVDFENWTDINAIHFETTSPVFIDDVIYTETQKPFVAFTIPTNNGSYTTDLPLQIHFNKNIFAGAGTISVFKNTQVIETFAASNSQRVTIIDSTLYLFPECQFEVGQNYKILVNDDAIHDGQNNYFQGLWWNFSVSNAAPQIDAQTLNVNENLENGSFAGKVLAYDFDVNQTLLYQIVSQSTDTAVVINENNGELYVYKSNYFDYELNTQISLVVKVTDNGVNQLSNSAVITLKLNNLQEAPNIANPVLSTRENISLNSLIGNLEPYDDDGDNVSEINLISCEIANAIRVDNQGNVYVNDSSAFNYEQHQSIAAIIQLIDDSPQQLSINKAIKVKITDINESPIIGNYNFYITDDASNGDIIGSVSAIDEDYGQTITYFIQEQSIKNVFDINSTTGEIKIINDLAIDSDLNPVMDLKIAAKDNASPPLTTFSNVRVHIYSVGIEEDTENAAWTISPNPANNNIEICSKNFSQNAGLKIFNSNGQLVKEKVLNCSTQTISLSEIKAGIYFIQIVSKKTTFTKKIIIY